MQSATTFSIEKTKLKQIIEHNSPTFSENTNNFVLDNIMSEKGVKRFVMDLKDVPSDFADFIVKIMHENRTGLGATQIKAIKIFLGGIDNGKFLNAVPTSVKQVSEQIKSYKANKKYNMYVKFMGKIIPCNLNVHYNSYQGNTSISLDAFAKTIDGLNVNLFNDWFSYSDIFDEANIPKFPTIQAFLESTGLLIDHPDPEFDEKQYMNELEELAKWEKQRVLMAYHGSALENHTYSWFTSVEETSLGTEDAPIQVITESQLELSTSRGYNYYGSGGSGDDVKIALTRVFSFSHKKYFWVWIKDLEKIEWDTEALTKLVLPPVLKKHVLTLFSADQAQFGMDFLKGKTPGLIIMASGGPGIGKTATAEAYSQHAKRPLYILETAELGVDPAQLEERLTKIMIRIQKWNAILLMDEADIFLSKRDNDLKRSAVVGIFLRIIDQFSGFLFLTTNRPEVIDPAFDSRIVMHLKYPKLSEESRKEIWMNFIELAKLKIIDMENIDKLAAVDMNGREIRNKARLAKILFEGEELTIEKLVDLSSNH